MPQQAELTVAVIDDHVVPEDGLHALVVVERAVVARPCIRDVPDGGDYASCCRRVDVCAVGVPVSQDCSGIVVQASALIDEHEVVSVPGAVSRQAHFARRRVLRVNSPMRG
jgi:hypothetical protein